MRMTSIRQMEYLVAVADVKHFGRAAQRCNVSQPTLSQQLKTLEDRLKVKLVERQSNGVQMTPVGRIIAERSRDILVAVQDMQALAKRASEGTIGTVRFGVSPTLGPYLMPDIIAKLHSEMPELKLYIREGIPSDQAEELSSGVIDVLLGPLPIDGTMLHVEPLFQEPLHIIAPPDHELASKDDLTNEDMAKIGFLTLDPRHHFYRQVERICASLNARIMRDYEGTSLDSLRQMVGSGIGLAIMPEFYLRSESTGENMVTRLTPKSWSAKRSIAMAWRRGSANEDDYRQLAERIRTIGLSQLQRPFL